MAQIILSETANADTDDILDYLTAEAGSRIAARYLALFERLFDRLADHPASGATRPGLVAKG